ncbi:hypothetical protein [Nonomuraea basaltis]|uniref:hypothetical protein n=1 Tax=Nonomuraea basaltis TaxID=2495887 RepID=UPI00110C4F2A|nr:hypothetical protein [Nonomuraea basaltis]TMR97246.1 hypothetical protein EJK15_18995 [Nonomuraea basaltis]
MLVSLAAAIVCGAQSLLGTWRLQAHPAALFGAAPSGSTTHRALAGPDEPMPAHLTKIRAKISRQVWQLLHLGPGGFPGGHNRRTGWPGGMRLLRAGSAPRHVIARASPGLALKTVWKYSLTATNIGRTWSIADFHRPQRLDALARAHAVVEERVRARKSMGLHNPPSQGAHPRPVEPGAPAATCEDHPNRAGHCLQAADSMNPNKSLTNRG